VAQEETLLARLQKSGLFKRRPIEELSTLASGWERYVVRPLAEATTYFGGNAHFPGEMGFEENTWGTAIGRVLGGQWPFLKKLQTLWSAYKRLYIAADGLNDYLPRCALIHQFAPLNNFDFCVQNQGRIEELCSAIYPEAIQGAYWKSKVKYLVPRSEKSWFDWLKAYIHYLRQWEQIEDD
jgi:hypothetical protein